MYNTGSYDSKLGVFFDDIPLKHRLPDFFGTPSHVFWRIRVIFHLDCPKIGLETVAGHMGCRRILNMDRAALLDTAGRPGLTLSSTDLIATKTNKN